MFESNRSLALSMDYELPRRPRESRKKHPRELLRSFLGTKMKLGEAQKSYPEAPESLENDLKIENLHFHETL